MSQRKPEQPKARSSMSAAPSGFHAVVAPVDLTPLTDRVLARLAQLPLASGATVTLQHVVPSNLPAEIRRSAQHDAERALTQERAALRGALPRGATVSIDVRVGVPAAAIATATKRLRADLVVMGRGGGRGLRDEFLGSTAERVLRQARVPVLAVRGPVRGPYRKPAVALDPDEACDDVIAALLHLLRPPRPAVSVIHAFDVPFRGLRYPSLTDEGVEGLRGRYRRAAMDGLSRALAAGVAEAGLELESAAEWRFHLRGGDTRAVIAQAVQQHRSDLVALATRGHRGLAHAFLGTVAGDVLRRVGCDVLVVPPRAP